MHPVRTGRVEWLAHYCRSWYPRCYCTAWMRKCQPAMVIGQWPMPAMPANHLQPSIAGPAHGLPSPRACVPRLLDSLQPFPPVSPERGGASRLPCPNNDDTRRPHSRPHRPPKLAPQPGFLPRRRPGRSLPSTCARLPSLGPRMSPQAPPTCSRSLVILGLGEGVGFFLGSAETSPLVVLRNHLQPSIAGPARGLP